MNGNADITCRWAGCLVDGLAAAGLKRIVLSPGSRSTPLALAALRHPALTSHVVVDERAAAFFALGLAKAAAAPVGLVATSGSAVANWWPAVVEADMARVPLLLLSADRPPELHDCGANQTMDQLGLFGSHVRLFRQLPPAESETDWLAHLAARSIAASLGPLPGPVHLNVPLREPLVPVGDAAPTSRAQAPQRLTATLHADAASVDAVAKILASGPGAIVCGPDDLGDEFRAAVAALARRLGVPLFADVLSGLRLGPQAGAEVLAYPDQVARTAPAPAWLLRFGGMPVAKALADWLMRCRGRPQIVVASHPRPADPTGTASHLLQADPAALCDALAGPAAPPAWREEFQRLDRSADAAAAALCGDHPVFEGALLRGVLRALPEGTGVFLGNSLTVRSAEWFAGRGANALHVFGNRGVSGIDGNLSTAFGIAAARGRALAVVGDLAFLHDLNSLALARHGKLAVLLLDNGGGGIFDHLAQSALPEFEQAWLTPQSLDAAAAAQAFGLGYRCADRVDALVSAVLAALEAPDSGIVHVRIDRRHSRDSIRAFHSASMQGA
ncbi:MAG: 2-succinyl-5-enolpyruvyl-6-hydroxy-3-cyclohexene-1-carboxylic-acid synthase [Rhodocyclaceae bacterium]|nr:2-succinyl-5-enolpyruvyl-6-hydroxy-3-cyclohexene-1-carboxylic-acid synthase [Rhodocyclaceae bacterium]